MNIIIADDSLLSRSYIKKILSVSGFADATLHEVSNGKDALDLLEKMNISCLFLDINMPVMTGIELVENLHQKGIVSKTDIVITSSLAEGQIMENLKKLGVKHFLRKPFTPESLSKIVDILKGGAK